MKAAFWNRSQNGTFGKTKTKRITFTIFNPEMCSTLTIYLHATIHLHATV